MLSLFSPPGPTIGADRVPAVQVILSRLIRMEEFAADLTGGQIIPTDADHAIRVARIRGLVRKGPRPILGEGPI